MIVRSFALALGLAGCSFVFVQGPPSGHERMEDFHCTNSDVAPMLDALLAGANGLALTLAGSHSVQLDESTRNAVVGVDLALIVLHTVGAIYGFIVRSNCQEALEDLAARRRHKFRMFAPAPPPPPPPAPAPPPEAAPIPEPEPPPAEEPPTDSPPRPER